MEALITRTDGLMFVILLMVAFALWLQRYKVFKSLGPVLTVVVLGIISMVGCIVDGPTSSLTAAGANWKSLINVGLIMGVLAGAAGNYVGITVVYIVKAVCGL